MGLATVNYGLGVVAIDQCLALLLSICFLANYLMTHCSVQQAFANFQICVHCPVILHHICITFLSPILLSLPIRPPCLAFLEEFDSQVQFVHSRVWKIEANFDMLIYIF